METALAAFMTTSALAFMLTFVRLGTAIMIMPGVGDSFVSPQVRLSIAVALSFILFPLVMPYIPNPLPGTFVLLSLIIMEFIIGLLFGTIARILMTALDTAGMVMSISSGLGNAQIFNPQLAGQGSILGAFMSVTGAVILFATDLHHLLFRGIIESYELFPVGSMPETGSMAYLVSATLSKAFAVGVMVAAPFIVLTMILYAGMGVLSRLMPQIQVFMIAIPLQIYLSVVLLMITLSAGMLYWVTHFENGMVFFLRQAGG